MRWYKRIRGFFTRRKEWIVHYFPFGDYQFIEITDHDIQWSLLPIIYRRVFESAIDECPFIVLSQYIDEDQGMMENKERVLTNVIQQFNLEISMTQSYDVNLSPNWSSRQYVVNLIGTPNYEWVEEVIRYGGINLANILYGLESKREDWNVDIIRKNQTFVKWYELQINDDELVLMRKAVKALMWTSDYHINALVEPAKMCRIISALEEVAREHSRNIIFQEEDPGSLHL